LAARFDADGGGQRIASQIENPAAQLSSSIL
jgi:hypothetical protein